jgi:copper transporter 1
MTRRSNLASALTLFFTLTLVRAHDDGMDMTMDGAMALDTGHGMMSNLHFRPFGDTLWFLGWVPESAGAMAGACVGLFLLGVLERWVASVRSGAERAWRARCVVLSFLCYAKRQC